MEVRVYILCGDADRGFREALEGHLRAAGIAAEAIGPRLSAGTVVAEEVARQLGAAEMVVLLYGPELLVDPHFGAVVEPLLRRPAKLRPRVLPVRLRPVAEVAWIEALAPINDKGTWLSLQPAAEHDGVWMRVAQEVRRALGDTIGDALGAALHLDRRKQWGQLCAVCTDPAAGDHLLLLHGRARQGLGFFCERAARFLSSGTEGCPLLHRVIKVPLWGEERMGAAAEDYAEFLREALAEKTGLKGAVGVHLRELSREHPLFLLLGEEPLSETAIVEEGEREALWEFLGQELPGLLRKTAAAGRQRPVRALLAFEDDHPAQLPAAQAAAQAAREQGLAVTFLEPLKLPPWAEIREDVAVQLRQDPAQLLEFEKIYGLIRDAGKSFEDLAKLLDKKRRKR